MTTSPLASSKYLLLDTHVVIWLATNDPRLAPKAVKLSEEAFYKGALAASVISAWEIGVLCAKNRLVLARSPIAWFDEFIRDFKVNLLDLTPEVAINSSYLPGGIHADPADRILIATALAHDVALMTADSNVLKYCKATHLKTIAAS